MAEQIIEGSISVKAALLGRKRTVFELYIDKAKKDKNTHFIVCEAERCGVKVNFMTRGEIDAIASGKTHGGIAALVGESTFCDAESLFAAENPFIALLEGVEDPYNFGDAIRSLYAAGATGLLLPERNWLSATSTVIKASAGACEYIPTAVTDDFEAVLRLARSKGITVLCAERKDAVPLYSVDLKKPIIFAVGGEMRGLSKKITENADRNVYIPYGSDFRNALSAASACAVCGFEVMRQRMA